ncbi:MAG: photosystem II reaction center protein Ycf12 [Cyanobacteria bacterium P01_H01_bin.15]
MDFITNTLSGLNIEVILQLTFVSLIIISGPLIVFLLFARQGDL